MANHSSAISLARSFQTFHSTTTAVPPEITTQILYYVIADAQLLPLGGGVARHRSHHPIASVSRSFRSIYLNHPYPTSTKDRATAPVKLRLGEALEFDDLETLTAFFQRSLDVTPLPKVRFLSISYLDNHATRDWRRRTVEYAYEAFESLYSHWNRMHISWLRLCLPCFAAISSVDDPGVWSLLKIRNLAHLTILGTYGCIESQVLKCLRARTRQKKLFPWRPLGLENPRLGARQISWGTGGQLGWLEQFNVLEARYQYMQDRKTVTARRTKQRAAYHKRRRRWPMLSKRRKRGYV